MKKKEQEQQQMTTEVYDYTGGVEATDLPFDFNRTGRLWEDKYGITEVPLLVKSASGKLYDDKRLKGIFQDGKYKRIVSRRYVVFPNQEVDELLHEFAERDGLEVRQKHTSHYGDAMYWEVLSNQLTTQVDKGDTVRVGCVVRNSIGTYVALGADMFTYRLVCTNGAIAKGHDLGSIAIRHIGNHDNMLNEFSAGIKTIIGATANLVEQYYRQSKYMNMNERIAEAFADRIPQRALPDAVEVDAKTGKVSLTGIENLWDSFNEITAKAWHHAKSGFLTKNHLLQHAHKVLIKAVDGDYSAAAAA